MRRFDEDRAIIVTIYVMLIAMVLSGAVNWLAQLGYL
jgi:hypothetical protein